MKNEDVRFDGILVFVGTLYCTRYSAQNLCVVR